MSNVSHGGRPVNILRSEEMQGIIAHFENRRRLYFSIFALGFFAGYPAAEMIIEWLLETDGFVPEGVELIVLQPLEVVLLQLRIASQIAIGMTVGAIILDLSWVGNRRVSGDYSLSGEAISGVLLSIIMIIILGILGLAYAHEILIPFLLEYLAEDSASSGLQSTWQLQSWVGFVTGLYFSSLVGFQVPVVVFVLLRSQVIEKSLIVENRGLIWFAALFIGALISPPDPISLFLVGGPMLVLLEMALVFDGLARG